MAIRRLQMGRTLFQIICDLVKSKWNGEQTVPEPDERFFNPLKLKVNKGTLRINDIEYEDNSFKVEGIHSVERLVNNQTHKFSDYLLVDDPYEGEPIRRKLRVVPTGDEQHPYHFILLQQIGDCVYDKTFHDGLAYEQNQGIFQEGEASYKRVNSPPEGNITEPWVANASARSDENNGRIAVGGFQFTYWDFWRQYESNGIPVVEFYIVEMDNATGYFTFWVGKMVDPNRISVA